MNARDTARRTRLIRRALIILPAFTCAGVAVAQLTLPYSGTINLNTPAFTVTNSSNTAIYGKSGGSRGVSGDGGSYGVYGSSGNEGVHGQGGTTGVFGSGTSYAIYGSSSNEGVHGQGGLRGVVGNGYIGVDGTGSYGVYGTGDWGVYGKGTNVGVGIGVAGTGVNYGVYAYGNFGGTGNKYFVEPHPTDPDKEIRFVCLEGPESGTYFRGSARTVNGVATISVPESFRMVTDDKNLTVVLAPMGELAVMACVRKSLDTIVIKSSRDVDFDYVVNGVRKAFRDHQPISKNEDFVPRSAEDADFTKFLPAESVRRLKASGILNEDGSIRLETAERLGWSRMWAERERASADSSRTDARLPAR